MTGPSNISGAGGAQGVQAGDNSAPRMTAQKLAELQSAAATGIMPRLDLGSSSPDFDAAVGTMRTLAQNSSGDDAAGTLDLIRSRESLGRAASDLGLV